MVSFNSFSFLCRCLSRQEQGNVDPSRIRREINCGSINWQEVIAIGDRHFVLPLLHYMLVDKGLTVCLPKELQDTLATLHELNRQRNKQLKEQLSRIIKLLNTLSVTPVLLKGATALFSELYPDPACRMMNDLDLLVPADRLQSCAALLEAEGYSPMECGETYEDHHHWTPLVHPDRIARVELHREIAADPVARILSSDAIRNEAIMIHRDGLRFQLCSNTHLAMHNILHHQLSGIDLYSRRTFTLYQVYDLVQLMHQAGDTIFWKDIFFLCKQHKFGRPTASYFMLIKQLFNEPLPPGVPGSTGARLDWFMTKSQLQYPLFQYYFQIAVHLLQDKKHRSVFLRQLCTLESYKEHFKRLVTHLDGR